MAEKEVAIRAAPEGPNKKFDDDVRRAILDMQARMREQEKTILSLAELLRGTAPSAGSPRAFQFPAVANIQQESLANSVRFVFGTYKQQRTPGTFDKPLVATPGKRTELWRALEDENSIDAQRVTTTTLNAVEDHPPPGIVYRYWLRYASDEETQAGPFTPVDGMLYVAQEVQDPEAEFDPASGGIFLDTFQNLDVDADYLEVDTVNNHPVITYPTQGVVGGTVVEFAGDEAWRVHNALIPFDPSVLYRVRVGVRYTVAPSNPARMKFSCGVVGVAGDGSTLISNDGQNEYDDPHAVAASNKDLIPGGINNWQTFTGYISGLGLPTGEAPNIYAPSPLFTGVKFIRPFFRVNFDDGNGTVQVDYIRIETLNPLDVSITGTLTLNSFAVPANQLNRVISYAGASGTFEMRYGSYLLNGTGAAAFSILSNPNGLTASIHPVSGDYAVTAGFPDGIDVATITFRAIYNGVTVDRIFTLTKAVEGAFNWSPVAQIDSGGGTVLIDGTTFTKTGGVNQWDSSVRSVEGYTEGAFASAQAGQTNMDLMFGLNTDPTTNANYTTLDYAWYMSPGGAYIYESNVNQGSFGAYTIGTLFAIRHTGNLVQYIKDGVVVRSVSRADTTPLYFDSSFYQPNSKLTNVHFGPAGRGAEADPNAVFLETFEQPWETRWANDANAITLVVSYPNNGQFGGKVIRAQGMLFIFSNERIPFDANALYRISARVRRTTSGGGSNENVFIGCKVFNSSGLTINVQWNCASAFDLGAYPVGTWVDLVGWFRGLGSLSGVAANNDSPTNLDVGTVTFSPEIVLNHNSGTGTQECDFIKIERLVNPNDADNSDKNRIVPDSEFSRATDVTYWWNLATGSSLSTTAPAISLTGGAVAGYCRLALTGVTSPTDPRKAGIYSRRRTPYQVGNGQLYTIKVRWRRHGAGAAFPLTITAFAVRHATSPSSSSFNPASGKPLYGGLTINAENRTADVWQEDSGLVFAPNDSAAGSGTYPYLAAAVEALQSGAGGGPYIDVDYVQLEPGAGADPCPIEVTGTTSIDATFYAYKKVQYNSGSPGTITLPTLSDDSLIGVKIYFEQIGAGLLSIAVAGGNTLQSAPNTTGTRSLTGQYAKCFVECINSSTWRVTGQLA